MDFKNIGKKITRGLNDVQDAPFVKDLCKTLSNMYRLGWDERNGGNVSVLLSESEVSDYIDTENVLRTIPMNFKANELIGRYFIVTGTGKYFKNAEADPETNLGIIRVAKDGETAELLWGFKDGGKFTSELPAHLMSHTVRLKQDINHKVVMHTHPTNLLCMTFVHDLDEREFTRSLWRTCTECMVVFSDGVAVLPWMLCGTNEIGEATAEKMKDFRLVVWGQHGIYGTGKDLDEAFGLIETAEKAAEIYLKTLPFKIKNTITDENLKVIAEHYGVKYKDGWLDV